MTQQQENQDEQGFELELSEETLKMLEDYANKSGQSQDKVAEFIIKEFLQYQLPIVQKKSEETGVPLNELLGKQFHKLLEMIISRELK